MRNGGFEGGSPDGRGGGVPYWSPFESGYLWDRQTVHNGDQAIRCDSVREGAVRGAYTTIALNQKSPVSILITGWSKADSVSGRADSDYALYVDVTYTDGSQLYGQAAAFGTGTHDWQQRRVLIFPQKPMASLTVYALFRKHSGTVWFDDFSVREMKGEAVFDGQFLTRRPQKEGSQTVAARAVGKDGLTLGFNSKGAIAEVLSGGQSVASASTGGFWLRDVASNGDLFTAAANVQAAPNKSVKVSGAKNGIQFFAKISPDKGALFVDGEIKDVTKTDRAVSTYFVLPLKATGWQWGQDIRTSETIAASTYTNQVTTNVGATGTLSLYPFVSVSNSNHGVGIANQMDWCNVYRIFYNGSTQQLVIAFDFALTGKTAAYPKHSARFRFHLFRMKQSETKWGFRAAAQRFYQLNSQVYARRAKAEGIWIPFTAPHTVEKPEDFGFAYHEGDNSIKEDDARGILSLRYVEPMSFWMPMPPNLPRTYDNALVHLETLAKGKDAKLADQAKAVLSSGTQDERGRYNLEFRREPWADGAVFVLNPNPELPTTPDKPTKAALSYSFAIANQLYSADAKAKRGEQDGEYLDSLETWADTLDYRPQHLASSPFPVPFETNSYKPVLPQWYSTYTFTQFLSNDLHNRDKILMANATPIRYSIFAPLCDVLGIEANWLDATGKYTPETDSTLNLRRTMSGKKPYLILQNTDYDKFTPEYVEKYFARCLFYGIYPSMFSANAADNPYWETPRRYNRDRKLFKKYIPLVKRLSAADWEPLTYATVSNRKVWIERYGKRLFTLYNATVSAHETTLTLSLAELGLPPTATLRIKNLIDGTEQTFSAQSKWTLAPEQVLVLEILP